MPNSTNTTRVSILEREIREIDLPEPDDLASALFRVERNLIGVAPPPSDEKTRYIILRLLGSGGFGRVSLAYDSELDRKVALKQLYRRTDSELLMREAQLLAQLRHPNIVSVHDIAEVATPRGRRLCIVMEYVEGVSLKQWLKTPRRRHEVLRVLCEAGRGLAAAHNAGIVHRDFKPANVLLDSQGRARVLDFGMSQRPKTEDHVEESLDSYESISRDTPGTIAGTPAYMAPELFSEPQGNVASDVFAFGVTLWEALTGARPFQGKSIAALRARIVAGELEEPRKRIPRRMLRIAKRALAYDPEDRYPDIGSLLVDLTYNPWQPVRQVALALASVLTLAAAYVLIVFATRPAHVEVSVAGPDGPLQPSGVWVDDTKLERTTNGASGLADPGLHLLRVEAEGMELEQAIVNLERGMTHQRTVVLNPQTGMLDIQASPTGASIWIDDIEYGSRIYNQKLRIGQHHLHAHLSGHYSLQAPLPLANGQTAQHYISLEPAIVWSRDQTGVEHPPEWIGDVTGDGQPEVAHRLFSVITVSDPWNDREIWRVTLANTTGQKAVWFKTTGGFSEPLTYEPVDDGIVVTRWHHPKADGARPTKAWRIAAQSTAKVLSPVLLARAGDIPDTVVLANFPEGETVALDLDTGAERWRVPGTVVESQTAIRLADGRTEVVQIEGTQLRALDALDGHTRFALSGFAHTLKPLDFNRDSSDDLVVKGLGSSESIVLDGNTKTPLASFTGTPVFTPREHGPMRLIALRETGFAQPGQVHIVDHAGEVVWSDEVGPYTRIYDWPAQGVDAGMIVYLHQSGVEFRRAEDGTVVDQIAIDGPLSSHPLRGDWNGDGRRELVLGTDEQTIVSVQPGDGQVSSVPLESRIRSLIALDDANGDGWLNLLVDAKGPRILSGPKQLWSRVASYGVRSTPVVADFDADGSLEVAVFGAFSTSNTLHLFDAKTGRIKAVLPGYDDTEVIRPPTPIPRTDGGFDLIALGGRSTMRISGQDASLLHKTLVTRSYASPVVDDIDGDGTFEVLIAPWGVTEPLEVRRVDDFSLKWSFPIDDGVWANPLVLERPEGQGKMIVVATHRGDILAIAKHRELWRTLTGFRQVYAPSLYDVDGDGRPELLVSTQGKDANTLDLLAVETTEGRIVKRWPQRGSNLGAAIALEGSSDLVADSAGIGIVRFTRDNQIQWSFNPTPSQAAPRASAPIQAASLTDDGQTILAPLNGTLYALDAASGQQQWRFTTNHENIEAMPVVVDIDGDLRPEVLVAGHDRKLVVLKPPR